MSPGALAEGTIRICAVPLLDRQSRRADTGIPYRPSEGTAPGVVVADGWRHGIRCSAARSEPHVGVSNRSGLLGLRRGLCASDGEVGAAEEEAMDTEARYLSGEMAPRGVEPLEGGHVAARH
jgi:hypothetical protein